MIKNKRLTTLAKKSLIFLKDYKNTFEWFLSLEKTKESFSMHFELKRIVTAVYFVLERSLNAKSKKDFPQILDKIAEERARVLNLKNEAKFWIKDPVEYAEYCKVMKDLWNRLVKVLNSAESILKLIYKEKSWKNRRILFTFLINSSIIFNTVSFFIPDVLMQNDFDPEYEKVKLRTILEKELECLSLRVKSGLLVAKVV